MKLYAISDLHLRYRLNREALQALRSFPEDWLIMAGDLGEQEEHVRFGLEALVERFAKVLWTPGNHDLWSPRSRPDLPRGQAKYQRLVSICREYGVLTPEDPYVRWPGDGPPRILAPTFTLYDYSFRPDDVPADQVLAWAAEQNVVCADEALLHSDPYPTKGAWCAARCQQTEKRLQRAAAQASLILINHYPLRPDLARLRRIPRFSPWCGTTRTADWHRRFRAEVVVYGHLHIRGTHLRDGVRFEEVSLGYPRDWDPAYGVETYLREILPGPGTSD